MMSLTEQMNRIEYLTSQTLVHVQEENYQKARDDLNNIQAHTIAAQSELDQLLWVKSHRDSASEETGL